VKVANKEALAAFNCLLSVVGAFVFAFFATGLLVKNNAIAQVLVAVIVSTIVAIADVYFLLKKLHFDEIKNSDSGKASALFLTRAPLTAIEFLQRK
jgi:undecaprenyl pyrophosphate phosphatase UppP